MAKGKPWELDWAGAGGEVVEPEKKKPWEMDWGGATTPLPAEMDDVNRLKVVAPALNRGVFVNLPGAAVDTALNVADLGRAAYGTVGHVTGLLSASDMPEPLNRENYVLSSDWNAKKIRELGGSKYIDNPNPEDPLSRIIYGGLSTAPMAMAGPGNTGPALLRNMVGTGIAGAAGQTMAEAGGNNEAQLLASMAAPLAVTTAGRMGANQVERMRQQEITNRVRDESVRAAKRDNLVVPPMAASLEAPGAVNRTTTFLGGGKSAMEQDFAIRNRGEVMAIVKRAAGINPDADISTQGLRQAREHAGNVGFAPVRAIPHIQADAPLQADLARIRADYVREVAGGRSLRSPEAEVALNDAIRQANRGGFTGDQAVSYVSGFRESGFANRRATTENAKRASRTQLALAQALDDLIARHLEHNDPQQGRRYLAARERIGTIHDIEDAFNPATGDVDTGILKTKWADNPEKMTGPLASIGRAASFMPQAMKVPTTANAGSSNLPTAGIVGATVAAEPTIAALGLIPSLQAGVRRVAMSPGYQRRFVNPPANYNPSRTARLSANLLPRDMSDLLGAYVYPGMGDQY